jgi:3-isopropylmalate/(R)-2-methylmalate dehydratase large subunit
MGQTLYDKVFDSHSVAVLPSGQHQLFMGLHLLHEVTSPQAFSSLDERGLKVAYPERTFATADHIIPRPTSRATASASSPLPGRSRASCTCSARSWA